MTPADLQNELIKRLQILFTDFPLPTLENEKVTFNIYKQNVPEQMTSEFDYSDESGSTENSLYPFVVVKLDNGEKGSNFDMMGTKIQLIIGVRNEGFNGEGYEDVMSAMQLILNDFDKTPNVNQKALLEYPLKWVVHDENTYPHFFAGVESTWKSHTLNRTDIGGFLHGRN